MLTLAEFNRTARDYVTAFARRGSATFIANLDTQVQLYRWGDLDLPVTVNDGSAGTTFVCSPRVGYIDYPLEELAHFPNPRLAPVLRAIVRGTGSILSLCDANRIVHVNNWMLSTNLPIPLDPALVRRQTDDLVAKYPAHLLAMRSLTRRHNGPLMAALEAAGWALLPSRQVFLIADLARECASRRDFRRDEALWRRGDYRYEELSEITAEDAARIAALYTMLYRDKYSRLNPAYTPEFVALTHRIGLIRYLVLRDRAGTIQGFGGMYRSGPHATMPLLGYNTAEPQDRGLYRLSFHAGTRFALDRQLHFNLSSGAAGFKRNRGQRPRWNSRRTTFAICPGRAEPPLPCSARSHAASACLCSAPTDCDETWASALFSIPSMPCRAAPNRRDVDRRWRSRPDKSAPEGPGISGMFWEGSAGAVKGSQKSR